MCVRHCAGCFIYGVSNYFFKILAKAAFIILVVHVRKVRLRLRRALRAELGFGGRFVRQQVPSSFSCAVCQLLIQPGEAGAVVECKGGSVGEARFWSSLNCYHGNQGYPNIPLGNDVSLS